jgi:hypothetical protein
MCYSCRGGGYFAVVLRREEIGAIVADHNGIPVPDGRGTSCDVTDCLSLWRH